MEALHWRPNPHLHASPGLWLSLDMSTTGPQGFQEHSRSSFRQTAGGHLAHDMKKGAEIEGPRWGMDTQKTVMPRPLPYIAKLTSFLQHSPLSPDQGLCPAEWLSEQ